VREHPRFGSDILEGIPELSSAAELVMFHHEQVDGSGYPLGISEDDIPLTAKIFIIIDNWESLTNDQVYRKAWPKENVVQYLFKDSGYKFDQELIKEFIRMIEDEENDGV
jgi:HD-GYP domain-containing protein (c-di-GMP phosphodiesterase class II)